MAEATISIGAVSRLDATWDKASADFYFVPGYKALLLDSGRVYLSLDPYDERDDFADERDYFVLEGETISLTLGMKPSK